MPEVSKRKLGTITPSILLDLRQRGVCARCDLAWRLAYEICERPEQAGLEITAAELTLIEAHSVNRRCLQSVVQVLDPQLYLRSVKRHLSEKQGLPTEHQRLTFAVAAAAGKAQDTAPLPGSAEGLLAGLDTWQVMSRCFVPRLLCDYQHGCLLDVHLTASACPMQALVYCNRKCVGKFTQPRLYSVSQLGDTSCVSSLESCPVQQLTIIYDCFKAACSESSARVSVPIVTSSSTEEYRFTVVGRCEGCNFVLPATYRFSGEQAAYELQKALYTSKHQQTQAAAAAFVTALSPLIATTDLALNFGKLLLGVRASEQSGNSEESSYSGPLLQAKVLSCSQLSLNLRQSQLG